MTDLDYAAMRSRYASERAKRLRPDGNDQYLQLKGSFARLLDDPYTERTERAARRDHVTATFVGGGFAGLVTAARLTEAGIADVRIVEKGGGFGGTWYWNRYPGAQCDTAAMIYLPLLEETGHMPTERYAHAPEILAHCDRIAARYGLAGQALLHTEVTDLEWDAGHERWIVRTDRGDEFTSIFVAIGTGPLHVAKLPGIPGIETFGGHSFHTSRWDYGYTGGDPDGAPMDRLAGRRVAVIGTGATAVQCVPHLAAACGELFVFQRTPSSVDERRNGPVDPDWFAGVAGPGWQQRWMDNFVANMSAGEWPAEDLVNDGWTDLVKRIRGKLSAPRSGPAGFQDLLADFETADFEKMNEIRGRVDAVVADPATAQALKAWYRQLCKRPCFHDEYLSAYNLPSVHLVDTDGKGVERITKAGVVVAGVEYPVDCVIYASGFEVGTEPTRRYGFDMTGRDGVRLSDYWSDGMRSLHGIHVHGFPNAFFVQLGQGGNFVANVPHNFTDAARTVAAVVRHVLDGGYGAVDVTAEAEDAWMEMLTPNPVMASFLADCTPGYYNNEGQGPSRHSLLVGYQHGPPAYFRYIDQWRRSGDFKGLEFTRRT